MQIACTPDELATIVSALKFRVLVLDGKLAQMTIAGGKPDEIRLYRYVIAKSLELSQKLENEHRTALVLVGALPTTPV